MLTLRAESLTLTWALPGFEISKSKRRKRYAALKNFMCLEEYTVQRYKSQGAGDGFLTYLSF